MILPFHLYGFIIGIAVVAAISLIEKQYIKIGYPEKSLWKIMVVGLVFGIIGARLWHVATDYKLYLDNFHQVFYIWNGGLSIFGGILGGVIGVYLLLHYFQKNKSYKFAVIGKNIQPLEFFDLSIFGLPIGQAIGRLGNFVNQELYGIPADGSIFSIFKIYISPENRLPGYENVEYYHPLFFYEMVAILGFSVVTYYLNSKEKLPKIGSGKLFLAYILFYSAARFFLDFIRIDKTMVGGTNIGVNQFILIVMAFSSLILLTKKSYQFKKNSDIKNF